ncbi:restriction endonuclease [Streptosporangium sp. NPDC002524]|uniref:nSTAND3 domain-containing NTPase n=1 Tax=Streptosporangium sp. NPDC002524 TaxID=3154537 RepID=UPI00331FACD5
MESFEALSDYDFERLVADLLSAHWRVNVATFPRGRDGGVDLSVLGPTDGPINLLSGEELVVQCKHYPLAGMAELRTKLKAEAKKPIVDQVQRYIIATSARLTRHNKEEIVALFGNRVSRNDIFAKNDLTDLLRRHPDVEKANLKLWLSSSAALQSMLHQVEHLRSSSLAEDLLRLRYRFVETPALRLAHNKLDQYGICVLAGPPGTGKTTTAHLMLLQKMSEGWQPITALSHVGELEKQIIPGKPQVLFYDDFLGQNSLDAKLHKGEDSELIQLMKRIEKDQSKAFVLTTRDYVLRQAKLFYEKLSDGIFDVTKVAVNISLLSHSLREHILYNQLYFSPIRELAASVEDASTRYSSVARHKNYNPRVTAVALENLARDLGVRPRGAEKASIPTKEVKRLDIPQYLIDALDNPETVWQHIIRRQLTSVQRYLLLARSSFGSELVYLDDLYAATITLTRTKGTVPTLFELDTALSVLDGDLLHIEVGESRATTVVEKLSPGLADAVVAFLSMYPDSLENLVVRAEYWMQVGWLNALLEVLPALDGAKRFWALLTRTAERVLLNPESYPVPGTLFAIRQSSKILDLEQRITLLAGLYRKSGQLCDPETTAALFGHLRVHIRSMTPDEIKALLAAFRGEIPVSWRASRTEVEFIGLKQLDQPQDLTSWKILRDVLDIVPTVVEYQRDMRSLFDEFVQSELDNLRQEFIDDYWEGGERHLIEQLEYQASRWGLAVDMDDVRNKFKSGESEISIFDVGDEVVVKYAEIHQRSKMDRRKEEGCSIFDYL